MPIFHRHWCPGCSDCVTYPENDYYFYDGKRIPTPHEVSIADLYYNWEPSVPLKPKDKVTLKGGYDEAVVLAVDDGHAWLKWPSGSHTTYTTDQLIKVPGRFEVGKKYRYCEGTASRECVFIQDGIAYFKIYPSGGSSYEGGWTWTKNRSQYTEID